MTHATYGNILYISEDSAWGKMGYKAAASVFDDITPIYWSPETPKPDLDDWRGDWIISFKSDLILPLSVIERAEKGAINFHPCPPKYRGIGGYWWAINNGDDSFGVTCHHMNERIDHGDIIKTTEFPIWHEDTVETLRNKAAAASLSLLEEIMQDITADRPLKPSGEQWGRHLYTQKELEEAQENFKPKYLFPSP